MHNAPLAYTNLYCAYQINGDLLQFNFKTATEKYYKRSEIKINHAK